VVSLFFAVLLAFPKIINIIGDAFPRCRRRTGAYLAPLGFGLLTGYAFLTNSPVEILILQFPGFFDVGLRLDVLSGLLSVTVSLIGASVMQYSVRYLADDRNQKQFHQNLTSTLCLVLLMLNSPNLIMFGMSWVGTSYFLHKLLLHFHERANARKAASQKFWVSRLGDSFLILAAIALFKIFNSLDFQVISANSSHALIQGKNVYLSGLAGILLVLGAMTKSAQFPFHYWLPKTMETPTPVSALMHAGIINSGGFLVIRMADFLKHIPWALDTLVVMGCFTAIYGSFIMLTQTSVKKSLAYSTISQMGFMMLQCGLGAFSIATVHIVGHAFYKAYLFLGSGTATDFGKISRYLQRPTQQRSFFSVLITGSVAILFSVLLGRLFGYHLHKPGTLVLLTVLGLTMAQMYLSLANRTAAFKSMFILWVSYFTLYHGVNVLTASSLINEITASSPTRYLASAFIGLLFLTLFLAQNCLSQISNTEFGKKLYVKSLNGGFLEH
jgi:NAD(P)H-quinone oxidoreductase subunit 5